MASKVGIIAAIEYLYKDETLEIYRTVIYFEDGSTLTIKGYFVLRLGVVTVRITHTGSGAAVNVTSVERLSLE